MAEWTIYIDNNQLQAGSDSEIVQLEKGGNSCLICTGNLYFQSSNGPVSIQTYLIDILLKYDFEKCASAESLLKHISTVLSKDGIVNDENSLFLGCGFVSSKKATLAAFDSRTKKIAAVSTSYLDSNHNTVSTNPSFNIERYPYKVSLMPLSNKSAKSTPTISSSSPLNQSRQRSYSGAQQASSQSSQQQPTDIADKKNCTLS